MNSFKEQCLTEPPTSSTHKFVGPFYFTHNAFVSGLSGQLHAADESYFTDIKNDVNTGFKNMFIFAVNFSGNNFALKRP
ncbi:MULTISPECIES: hypothetical protein [Pantoea]|uniref:hypothetical protein n=1 Tax=Pantoea TaxID=53335 RepID=UPI0013B471E1|nr:MULTISPECIES: hypothetical protein [Pantoea]MBB1228176.1 hypothetical protein [Pantoea pleuroti]MDH1170658.1 hypothetical protein [Pantoea agglomerans]URW93077.1 hypothetical protein NA598_01640 [Pantoea agglomerans]